METKAVRLTPEQIAEIIEHGFVELQTDRGPWKITTAMLMISSGDVERLKMLKETGQLPSIQ